MIDGVTNQRADALCDGVLQIPEILEISGIFDFPTKWALPNRKKTKF